MFIFLLVAVSSLPAQSHQPEKGPTVLRDKKGNLRAIEFPEAEKTGNLSYKEFLKQHFNVSSENEFRKSNDKQRGREHGDDHYDQYYKGIKVDGAG